MKTSLKIVGCDPSWRNWGIAIGDVSLATGDLKITDMRVILTGIKEDHTKRKSQLDIESAELLCEGVRKAIDGADIVTVEVPYGSQNASAAKGQGICMGVLGSVKEDHFVYVTPQSVKKIIGDPKATKGDVVRWCVARHPEAPWPMHQGKVNISKAEHMADAIVSIYAASQTKEFKQLISEYKNANQV